MKRISQNRQALTGVEVVVLIAGLCLLSVIALPALHFARLKADKAKSAANLRQIGKALQLFAQEHNDDLPPYRFWVTHLEPYMPVEAYWRPGGVECFYNGYTNQTGRCLPCGYGVERGIRFNYSLPSREDGAFREWSSPAVKLSAVKTPSKVLAAFEGLGQDTGGYCYWSDRTIQELWLDGHVAMRHRNDQPFWGDITLK